ncbi:hypothetical protein [Kosakonia oryziphila]|uniref:Uncharacterized protein n=1 Tax=Kosakonia oryziphila TaxID=1005667 RepID=A0A1C4GK03_9ENTR|nr:hypothetical protein [Kosakonia oryziphila]SCC68540.1 hypothetical protein GA0061070_10764 [Kosakonia oryziphila]
MKKWQFYVNDITVNVHDKNTVSAEKHRQLKAEGFHKMPFETEAENEAQAVDKMLQHFKDNTAALEEFVKDYCIPATIFELIYVVTR